MKSEASQLIDGRIAGLGGWRGSDAQADPRGRLEADEFWKWMGTPMFEKHGGICRGDASKTWRTVRDGSERS